VRTFATVSTVGRGEVIVIGPTIDVKLRLVSVWSPLSLRSVSYQSRPANSSVSRRIQAGHVLRNVSA
jgi:hypothetical protein